MATHKPSIVFFNRVYPPIRGATGRILRDLAHAFADKGWDVTVVTTGSEAKQEQDNAVHIIRVKAPAKVKSPRTYLWVWLKLFWRGLNLPPRDLIVTMTDPPILVVAGRWLALLKRSRHIHWCQDLYPDILPALGFKMPERQMKFLKTLSCRAMKKCDKVITIGRCMAKNLTHKGVQPSRVAVIPNWPDCELLPQPDSHVKPRRHPVRKIKKAKGARPFDQQITDGTDRKFRVLYSGNLGRAHPIRTILEAAALLEKDHPEIEFVFVGDGPNFRRLAQEKARRGLENIRLMPFQPSSRLRKLMESGDLHLITMKQESLGLLVPCKLYTALAVGRPCILIGPKDSETAIVIKDFKAGTVVAQGNAKQLADTIKEFRMDSALWFAAHEGAAAAGRAFIPEESFKAWIKRAHDVVNFKRAS